MQSKHLDIPERDMPKIREQFLMQFSETTALHPL